MKATAVAPGKTILVGEHFVVYDEPAIVMAINRHLQVKVQDRKDTSLYIHTDLGASGTFTHGKYKAENGGMNGRKVLEPIKIATQTILNSLNERRGLNIEVQSTIPMAVGLGSSGALAVATVAAIGKLLGKNLSSEEIITLSTSAERFVHKNPSGIDQAISTYGGVMIYKKNEGVTSLKVVSSIPLVIGNTGILRNTGKLVDRVKMRNRRFPKIMGRLTHVARQVSIQAVESLQNNDLKKLGELMDINHGLLVAIGVSHQAVDKLVHAAKDAGALGAKLTGAGGGGCVIALSTLENREKVFEAFQREGGTPIMAEKTEKGVYAWISE